MKYNPRLDILVLERETFLKKAQRRRKFCIRKGIAPQTDMRYKELAHTCNDLYCRILAVQQGQAEEYYLK